MQEHVIGIPLRGMTDIKVYCVSGAVDCLSKFYSLLTQITENKSEKQRSVSYCGSSLTMSQSSIFSAQSGSPNRSLVAPSTNAAAIVELNLFLKKSCLLDRSNPDSCLEWISSLPCKIHRQTRND
jgi:hypothetical protein